MSIYTLLEQLDDHASLSDTTQRAPGSIVGAKQPRTKFRESIEHFDLLKEDTEIKSSKGRDIVASSSYSNYIKEVYDEIIEELSSEFTHLEIDRVTHGCYGTVYAYWIDDDGEENTSSWNYRKECEDIAQIIDTSDDADEFKTRLKGLIEQNIEIFAE